MKLQKLCVVSFWAILLLFGNAMAETLFFDDFEGNAEIKWPDVPVIKAVQASSSNHATNLPLHGEC